MNIEIRKAAKTDLQVLLPLVSAYHEWEGIELTKQARQESITVLLNDLSPGHVWLVEESARVIGYIILCVSYSIEFSGYDAFIDEFFIEEEYRGMGYGTYVLDTIKKEAEKPGIRALHLEVARDNNKARALYEKAGLQPREKYVIMSITLANDEQEK